MGYNLNCKCFHPGATQDIEYGVQYIRYNALINAFYLHLVFCGIFIITRLSLFRLISSNKEIKGNELILKLHYMHIDSVDTKDA